MYKHSILGSALIVSSLYLILELPSADREMSGLRAPLSCHSVNSISLHFMLLYNRCKIQLCFTLRYILVLHIKVDHLMQNKSTCIPKQAGILQLFNAWRTPATRNKIDLLIVTANNRLVKTIIFFNPMCVKCILI